MKNQEEIQKELNNVQGGIGGLLFWIVILTILSIAAYTSINNRLNSIEQQLEQIQIRQTNTAIRTNEFRDKINNYEIPTAVQCLEGEINDLQNRVNNLEK
jgi:uncharacterized membrane protein YhaH (DUF805 family)